LSLPKYGTAVHEYPASHSFHRAQLLGWPSHIHPLSIWQEEEHPSPFDVSPSSHASVLSRDPSPQAGPTDTPVLSTLPLRPLPPM